MRKLTAEEMNDVIGWDVESWGKFIDFIEQLGIDFKGKKILEIGTGEGGISLYCGLMGGM